MEMLATYYCVTMQKNIRKKQEEFTNFINRKNKTKSKTTKNQ